MKSLISVFIIFYCLSAQTAASKEESSVSKNKQVQAEVKKPVPTASNKSKKASVTAVKSATAETKEKPSVKSTIVETNKKPSVKSKVVESAAVLKASTVSDKKTEVSAAVKSTTVETKEKPSVKDKVVKNAAVLKASTVSDKKTEVSAAVAVKSEIAETKEKPSVKGEAVESAAVSKASIVSDKKTEISVAVKSETTETKEKPSVESKTAESAVVSTASSESMDKDQKGADRLKAFKDTIASVDPAVELGLEYPLSFGVHGKFHINDSIYTRLGAGFTSELLVTAFAKIAPSLGYLSRQEANLISDVVKNSVLGALRLGWMPYTKKFGGPYMELGLLYLAFGQGETSGTVLNAAIETDLSQTGSNRYSVRSDILNGTFHIGYQIPIEENIHLNLELGVLKILYVGLKTNKAPASGVVALPEEQHKKFKSFLVDKGWIFPTLSAWLGFSF